MTVQEYFEVEKVSEGKNEFVEGTIVAMAGASFAHNQIVANLIFLINRCLWGTSCRVLPSDLLVKLEDCKRYVYPDMTIVCEPPELEKYNGLDVLLNPTVVIEVLSPSTSGYDKSDKLDCYLRLPSLQQLVFADSEKIRAMSYQRMGENNWHLSVEENKDNSVKINNCDILLDDIYKLVF